MIKLEQLAVQRCFLSLIWHKVLVTIIFLTESDEILIVATSLNGGSLLGNIENNLPQLSANSAPVKQSMTSFQCFNVDI